MLKGYWQTRGEKKKMMVLRDTTDYSEKETEDTTDAFSI